MSLITTRSLAGLVVGAVVAATATISVGTASTKADAATGTSSTGMSSTGMSSTGTPSTRSVTVLLKAPDAVGLAALARKRGLSHDERIAAVARLLPTVAEHERAVHALRAEGFTVTDESSWSVSASAPATTVADVFGIRPKLASHATAAQRVAATGALPNLPASLSSVASAVFATNGGPAAFGHSEPGGLVPKPAKSRVRPGDVFTGDGANYGYDFQDAYEGPSLARAGAAPADGSFRSQRLTIATLQLTGWNSGDLSDYATWAGLPFAGSTLTEVPVDQTSVPSADAEDDTSPDVEVDLDQEAILSTDPYAHQRAYFAPNTDAGFADALSRVLDDVTGSVNAYHGGDSHIGALSISWGECEAQNSPGSIQNTFEPILQSLVAAGVTVFASSGDQGVYDCTNYDASGNPTATPGVDYPAASPAVVGVGGTRLTSKTGAYNNGNNWSEAAWSCTLATDCFTGDQATGGSGGGVSGIFQEPTYQSSRLSATQNARRARLVPDIAADGDPATGFVVDTTDPTLLSQNHNRRYYEIGGTSLASPVSAALFTAMLSDHGKASGIGDLHSDLYDAPSSAFRDITEGHNGATDLAHAGTGYDTVTGLGAPYWDAIGNQIFDQATPKAKVTTSLPYNHTKTSSQTVKVAWTGNPATRQANLVQADVTVTRLGSMFPTFYDGAVIPTGWFTFHGKAGATYRVTVTVTDRSGDQSKPVSTRITVPIDDTSVALSRTGWQRHSATGAIGGSYVQSDKKTATATVNAAGDSYSIVFRVGPSLGNASVAVAGRHAMTVDLHATKNGFKTVHVWGGPSKPVAKRTIAVRESGSKAIGFDALFAYR